MKHFHKYAAFSLALALCLGLTACGADSTAPSDDSTDDNFYDVPNSFEGLVKDSEQMADLYGLDFHGSPRFSFAFWSIVHLFCTNVNRQNALHTL